jgi:hypothetical protein
MELLSTGVEERKKVGGKDVRSILYKGSSLQGFFPHH